jgi:PAS domain S-box-containing protein
MAQSEDDQKFATAAQREHRLEVLDSIFRAAPTGIGMVKNRVIVQANDRLCAMIGYPARELIGQNARMLYPTREEFEWVGREKYKQISRQGTGTVETRWLCKDGRIIDVLLSSTPLDLDDLSQGVTFTALDITERKRAEQTIATQKTYLAILHDITLGLLNRRSPEELLQALVTRAAELAGTGDGFAYVFDEAAGELVIRAACGRYGQDLTGFRVKPGEGLAGKVWQTGKTLLVEDYQCWENRILNAFFNQLGAAIGIPIKLRQKVLGVIGLGYFNSNRQFGPLEQEALERLADLAALCLDNTRLYDTLQKELAAKEKVEAALRDSEKRYRSVFENTGAGTVLSENDTTLSMVNEGFAEITGYSREEIEGRMKWTAIIDPEDHERLLGYHRLRRKDPENTPKAFECRIIDRQGRRRNMMQRVDLIPGTTTSVGSFMDITGQKETEAALRKYEQMVKSSTDYMALLDCDYVFQEVNQAYQKAFGQPRSEIVGRTAARVYGRELFEEHQKPRLDRCLSGEEVHVKGW